MLNLRALNFEADEETQAKGILDGTIDLETFDSVEQWLKKCWNPPPKYALKLCALNEIMGTCGREVIEDREGNIIFSYLNAGDMYIPTIAYDHERKGFRVLSYWDMRMAIA